MLQFYLKLIDNETDQEKFRQLYEQYHRLMHWEARRILENHHLAEDAVQEAFLRIIKNFDHIGEIFCPQTKRFVVIIVRNAARNLLAKEKKNNVTVELDAWGINGDEKQFSDFTWENLSSGVDETSDAVLCREIRRVTQALPEWAAESLMLSAVYGCTVKEIAIISGITSENAKKRLQRARALFQKKMKESDKR